jgi:TRAP-type mannitol/chloroaromatic compound transport system substrate-binding protein
MKKLLGALGVTLLLFSAHSSAQAQEVKWRLQSIIPVNTFFWTEMVKKFTDNLEMLSGGRLQITPFGVGEIVPAFQVHQEVAKGTVEAGWTSAAFLANADPTNAILSNFPGGPSPETYMHWYYKGGGKELFQQYRQEVLGVQSFLLGIGTTEFFAVSQKPVRTRDDLKGLKMRTTGAWATVMKESFDGSTVVLPSGEIFGALERKVIDAVDWAGPGGNLGMGFHKVARYLIVPGTHQPASPVELVINLDKWNALPDGDKQLIELAAQLTTFQSYLATGQADQDAMPVYRDNKNEFVTLDAGLQAEIKAETAAWLAARAKEQSEKGNPWTQRMLDSITAYQATWAGNAFTRAWDVE